MIAEMISFAGRKPNDNRMAIVSTGLPILGLQQGQPMPAMLQNSGITIAPDMLKVPFKLIPRPSIHYRGGAVTFVEDKAAAWKTQDQKFVTTRNEIKKGIAFMRDGGVITEDFDR